MTMARMARTRKNRRRGRNRRGGCCHSTISGMSLACFQERFRVTTKQTQLYAVCSRDHRQSPTRHGYSASALANSVRSEPLLQGGKGARVRLDLETNTLFL